MNSTYVPLINIYPVAERRLFKSIMACNLRVKILNPKLRQGTGFLLNLRISGNLAFISFKPLGECDCRVLLPKKL